MTVTPEWIIIVAPFLSGAAGVGLTAGVAWGVIKAKVEEHERRMSFIESKMEHQVGLPRCDKMRDECQDNIAQTLSEIKSEIVVNRNWVTDRFTEIARFMGHHNGK